MQDTKERIQKAKEKKQYLDQYYYIKDKRIKKTKEM